MCLPVLSFQLRRKSWWTIIRGKTSSVSRSLRNPRLVQIQHQSRHLYLCSENASDCLLPTDTKSGISFSQQPETDSSRARKTKIGVTECQGNRENHIGDAVASFKELPKFQQEEGNKHTRERQAKPQAMGLWRLALTLPASHPPCQSPSGLTRHLHNETSLCSCPRQKRFLYYFPSKLQHYHNSIYVTAHCNTPLFSRCFALSLDGCIHSGFFFLPLPQCLVQNRCSVNVCKWAARLEKTKTHKQRKEGQISRGGGLCETVIEGMRQYVPPE